MAIIGETKFVERLQFFNGQRLFAADLQGLEDLHREMRWLHNQSLHQPGVGKGYAISGERGDREVSIQPGYAIDAEGREIILTEEETLPVPPVADDGHGNKAVYDLVVFYPDDDALEESETRAGICLSRGTVRLREKPEFCWVKLDGEFELQPVDPGLKKDIQNGMKIRLARAEVINCSLHQKLSTVQRLSARPTAQPYVACGRTSGTGWTVEDHGAYFKFQRTVDTSAAEFRSTPQYFAHTVGSREIERGGSRSSGLIDGSAVIVATEVESFRLCVYVLKILMNVYNLQIAGTAMTVTAAALQSALNDGTLDWQVEWMGVEG
jgi:hypothetical protein